MKKLFFIIFILTSSLIYSQDIYINTRIFYVSARNGLRVRESPSLGSRIIKIMQYGESDFFEKRTKEKVTIDGISDYWYKNYKGGWVFGGYLTNKFSDNLIIGVWQVDGKINEYFKFNLDGSFSTGTLDTDNYASGKYLLNDNILEINYLKRDGTISVTYELLLEYLEEDKIVISNFPPDSYVVIVNKKNVIMLIRDNEMH